MTANFQSVQTIIRIAFFLDKPQNLPASNYTVLFTAIAALLATGFLQISVSVSKSLWLALLQIIIYGLIVAAVLYFPGRMVRWRQTMAAIYGTNCVVRCIAYPPISFVGSFAESRETVLWLAFLAIPFGIWGLCISTYIFREAMETTTGKAILLALGANLAVSIIVLSFAGEMVDPVTQPLQ